jgi:hypothetical protein
MSIPLQQVLAPVARSATSIERAFLQAGDSLNRGLSLFEQLGGSLSTLMQELSSGGMAEASGALERLSAELTGIGRRLPEDAATLQGLVAGNETIARGLDSLLENLRMMTIVARSFRIEAVVFGETSGLDSFTQDIGHLTNTVQNEVSRCAADHAKLTEQLRQVERAQVALDRDFREKLLALARELTETFGLIQERQRAGLDLMEDVAARSSRITQAAGMAMISLQAGDSTRQRLEHIAEGLKLAEALSDPEGEAGPDVPAEAKAPALTALFGLQAVQLQDTVEGFAEDVRQIDEALDGLQRDTHQLVDGGRATYGGAGQGSDSFLALFKARLSSAAEFLRACEASRHSVEHATLDLRGTLGDLNETILTLSATSLDLVLVGLNAGLKAGRLGSAGSSLVVIADEMKRLGQTISREAPELITVFDDVRQTSHCLDRENPAAEGSASAVAEVAAILVALDIGDQKIAAFLRALGQKVGTVDADLTGARRQFGLAVAMNDDLLAASDTLAGLASRGDGAGDPQEGIRWADSLMAPKYTMAREREIHARHFGIEAGAPEAAAPEPDQVEDWSDMGWTPAEGPDLLLAQA